MRPDLSICIPNYNHAGYLAAAIESALNQRNVVVEVLVSDNCSSDHSAEIISSFAHDHRLRAYTQSTTIPMTEHWNVVLPDVRGEWVVWLCSDDVLLPDFAENAFTLAQTECVSAVFLDYDFLVGNERVSKPSFYDSDGFIRAEDQFRILLKSNNWPLTGTMIRTEFVRQIGGFNPSYKFCPDWHMWLDLTSLYSKHLVGNISTASFLYRHHEDAVTNEWVLERDPLCEIDKMKKSFINRFLPYHEREIYRAFADRQLIKLARSFAEVAKLKECEIAAKNYERYAAKLEARNHPDLPSGPPGPPYPLPQ